MQRNLKRGLKTSDLETLLSRSQTHTLSNVKKHIVSWEDLPPDLDLERHTEED